MLGVEEEDSVYVSRWWWLSTNCSPEYETTKMTQIRMKEERLQMAICTKTEPIAFLFASKGRFEATLAFMLVAGQPATGTHLVLSKHSA